MNLLLSDKPVPEALPASEENRYVDLSALKISNCVGCFGCWVKTPGKCVIRDDAVSVYPLIAQSRRLIYVSRIRYGCYDTVMKAMLERAIPVQQAFLRLHRGETHHVQRDVAEKDAVIIAYGGISEDEQVVFQRLVARNANNMLFRSWKIHFVPEAEVESVVQREVKAWEKC